MPWLRRESLRRIACLLPVLALIVFCASCSDFWVSDSSVASVSVTPTALILKAAAADGTGGDAYSLSASATTVGGTTTDETTAAAWTSSAPAIVTVGASTGKLTVVGSAGNTTATIKATFGGQSATTSILTYTGTAPSTLAITATVAPGSVVAGQTFKASASAALNGNSTQDISNYVTWSTNNTATATVDAHGNVTVLSTAVAGGNFTITAVATFVSGTVSGTTASYSLPSI